MFCLLCAALLLSFLRESISETPPPRVQQHASSGYLCHLHMSHARPVANAFVLLLIADLLCVATPQAEDGSPLPTLLCPSPLKAWQSPPKRSASTPPPPLPQVSPPLTQGPSSAGDDETVQAHPYASLKFEVSRALCFRRRADNRCSGAGVWCERGLISSCSPTLSSNKANLWVGHLRSQRDLKFAFLSYRFVRGAATRASRGTFSSTSSARRAALQSRRRRRCPRECL